MRKDNTSFRHICEKRGHSTRDCHYSTNPKAQNKTNNKGRQSVMISNRNRLQIAK